MSLARNSIFLALLITTAVCAAGSWSHDFDSDPSFSELWEIPEGATAEDYLTEQYNHTANAAVGRSAVVSSSGPNNQLAHSFAFGMPVAGGNSVYFYDDGADLANYHIGVEITFSLEEGETGTDMLGIGVLDYEAGSNTEYILHYKDEVQRTGIERSTGWHRVQISWKADDAARVMLDDVLIMEASDLLVESAASFHVDAYTISGNNTIVDSSVWVDDVVARPNVVPVDFTETYEEDYDFGYWRDYGYNDDDLSTDITRSRTPGSGSLVLTASPQDYSDTRRPVAMPHNSGYASVWFYDDGRQPTEFSVYVAGELPGDITGDTFTLALGVQEHASDGPLGEYLVCVTGSEETTTASTTIARSVGWHQILVGTHNGGPGLKMKLDGSDFPNNVFPNLGTIASVGFATKVHGYDTEPVAEGQEIWLDDLSYYFNQTVPEGPPSKIDNWTQFE